MRVVLATPLYPPDIAGPAPYVKELAKRLSKDHDVTVVAYGRMPEKVEGVRIIAVPKDRPMLSRLAAFYRALREAAKDADIVIAENGSSVELPASLIGKRLILHMGDAAAHEHANQNLVRHVIERIAAAHAAHIVRDIPLPRPEILPLEEFPQKAMDAYELSWDDHVRSLSSLFHA
jgi:hypothetical protein